MSTSPMQGAFKIMPLTISKMCPCPENRNRPSYEININIQPKISSQAKMSNLIAAKKFGWKLGSGKPWNNSW